VMLGKNKLKIKQIHLKFDTYIEIFIFIIFFK
jgi:hypothetical protein